MPSRWSDSGEFNREILCQEFMNWLPTREALSNNSFLLIIFDTSNPLITIKIESCKYSVRIYIPNRNGQNGSWFRVMIHQKFSERLDQILFPFFSTAIILNKQMNAYENLKNFLDNAAVTSAIFIRVANFKSFKLCKFIYLNLGRLKYIEQK